MITRQFLMNGCGQDCQGQQHGICVILSCVGRRSLIPLLFHLSSMQKKPQFQEWSQDILRLYRFNILTNLWLLVSWCYLRSMEVQALNFRREIILYMVIGLTDRTCHKNSSDRAEFGPTRSCLKKYLIFCGSALF